MASSENRRDLVHAIALGVKQHHFEARPDRLQKKTGVFHARVKKDDFDAWRGAGGRRRQA